MKAESRTVEISIVNRQITVDAVEPEKLSFNGQGRLYIRRGYYYLVYDDYSPGLEGASTTLRIDPGEERVVIWRSDPLPMRQVFDRGGQTEGRLGQARLNVETGTLELELNVDSGRVFIEYSLYLEGYYTSKNSLSINWN